MNDPYSQSAHEYVRLPPIGAQSAALFVSFPWGAMEVGCWCGGRCWARLRCAAYRLYKTESTAYSAIYQLNNHTKEKYKLLLV